MLKYRSHKIVEAAKIISLTQIENNCTKIELDEGPGAEPGNVIINNNSGFIGRPTPAVGWYYIEYPDGYYSFSPAKSFEEGYTEVS